MPTTRSQASKTSGNTGEVDAPSKSDMPSGLADESPSGNPATPSTPTSDKKAAWLEGQSGQYHNLDLPPRAWDQAKDAFAEEFSVDFCSDKLSDEPYYAFQIVPKLSPQTVRIGSPRSPYPKPTCSCRHFQETQTPCKHVFWLLDRLSDREAKASTESIPLSKGDPLTMHSPFEMISTEGLDAVAKKRKWPFRSSKTLFTEESEESDDLEFSRIDQARDILSTFDQPRSLPEDYLKGAYEALSQSLPSVGDVLVPTSLETTILNLSAHDSRFFDSLRAAVPEDYCAAVYYHKLDDRARKIFTSFHDARITAGLGIQGLDVDNDDDEDDDNEPPSPTTCANLLYDIVQRTCQDVEKRAPLDRATKSIALNVLIDILDWVTSSGQRQKIYALLIGRPPSSSSPNAERDADSMFVVDALWGFTDVARDALDKIEELFDRIRAYGAPHAYQAEFTRLLEQLRAMPPGKRQASRSPVGGKPSKTKRMK